MTSVGVRGRCGGSAGSCRPRPAGSWTWWPCRRERRSCWSCGWRPSWTACWSREPSPHPSPPSAAAAWSRCEDTLVAEVQELTPTSRPARTTSPTLVGDLIDLEPLVHDAVVLGLPLNPRCDEDCQGLCTGCGVRRAELGPDHTHDITDPRWAALATLRPAGDEPHRHRTTHRTTRDWELTRGRSEAPNVAQQHPLAPLAVESDRARARAVQALPAAETAARRVHGLRHLQRPPGHPRLTRADARRTSERRRGGPRRPGGARGRPRSRCQRDAPRACCWPTSTPTRSRSWRWPRSSRSGWPSLRRAAAYPRHRARGAANGRRRGRLRPGAAVGTARTMAGTEGSGDDLGALVAALGGGLDHDLVLRAVTHRSFAYENGGLPTNERLEFLGDSVLGPGRHRGALPPASGPAGGPARQAPRSGRELPRAGRGRPRDRRRTVPAARPRRGGQRRPGQVLDPRRRHRGVDRRRLPRPRRGAGTGAGAAAVRRPARRRGPARRGAGLEDLPAGARRRAGPGRPRLPGDRDRPGPRQGLPRDRDRRWPAGRRGRRPQQEGSRAACRGAGLDRPVRAPTTRTSRCRSCPRSRPSARGLERWAVGPHHRRRRGLRRRGRCGGTRRGAGRLRRPGARAAARSAPAGAASTCGSPSTTASSCVGASRDERAVPGRRRRRRRPAAPARAVHLRRRAARAAVRRPAHLRRAVARRGRRPRRSGGRPALPRPHRARPAGPGFDRTAFGDRLRRRRTGLKRALLDQTLVSGVGQHLRRRGALARPGCTTPGRPRRCTGPRSSASSMRLRRCCARPCEPAARRSTPCTSTSTARADGSTARSRSTVGRASRVRAAARRSGGSRS